MITDQDREREEEIRRIAVAAAAEVAALAESRAAEVAARASVAAGALAVIAAKEAARNATDVWKWLLAAVFAALVAVFGVAYRNLDVRIAAVESSEQRRIEENAAQNERLATLTANMVIVMQEIRDSSVKIDRLLERTNSNGAIK